MPIDYRAIRTENERRYGTDIGRIGPMLLANRYADPMHFIFELLQNAEDAMAKREVQNGPRAVEFLLSTEALSITHFGKLFDEEDVRGICGIGESTKDLTSIGRFGIGFKSVYALTDSPEIHSGSEHFAIDNYVWPREIPAVDLQTHQTKINLPFIDDTSDAARKVLRGLQQLGPKTLLFLQKVEEISWSYIGGPSGRYLRETEELSSLSRKITVIGEHDTDEDIDEEQWIVFSKPVFHQSQKVGYVELAFALKEADQSNNLYISPISESDLVVYFPTVLSTYLGFLVQGPYRTTPSRDNIPESDSWNQHMINETSLLLIDALRELRDLGLLDVSAIQCLPLDASRFRENSRFAPLFIKVREVFSDEQLLPQYGGGYVSAHKAKLARTQGLRDLISSEQLSTLFDSEHNLVWLSEDITSDRTPEIYEYIKNELDVNEVTSETLIWRLTAQFLESQHDEWIEKLYIFFNNQRALFHRSYRMPPLIRLEDGSHVVPYNGDEPQAFLPSESITDFPTVRSSVCRSKSAIEFLSYLGVSAPDPVDDVIANILPKYSRNMKDVDDIEYKSDITRLLTAYDTDSVSQRSKLETQLEETKFIKAVNAGTGERVLAYPSQVYQATKRLKQLFNGVVDILIVDDSLGCLRGERIRQLLERTGVSYTLFREETETQITYEPERLARLRENQRQSKIAHTKPKLLRNYIIRGLEPLIVLMSSLSSEEALSRAALLWEELCELQKRYGVGAFQGKYEWQYYGSTYTAPFDADFVSLLNEALWVPDEMGTLQPPHSVMFEGTGWEENHLLLTKIHFRSPVINELAHEAGFEPEALDLLRKYGLTSADEIKSRLGLSDTDEDAEVDVSKSLDSDHLHIVSEENGPLGIYTQEDNFDRLSEATGESQEEIKFKGDDKSQKDDRNTHRVKELKPQTKDNKSMELDRSRLEGGGQFISYIALIPEDEADSDPDGLTSEDRMKLEEHAIKLILSIEPQLNRTRANNPGFDLIELGTDNKPVKWVEVKSMKQTLHDRPVGLTRTQFEHARKYGERYWVYIVEKTDTEQANILRIKNPAWKAETFTLDYGWTAVAEFSEDTQDFGSV